MRDSGLAFGRLKEHMNLLYNSAAPEHERKLVFEHIQYEITRL
jgi:hypothetical protein